MFLVHFLHDFWRKIFSLVILYYLTKFHCLVVFTSWDIGQYVYCNILLTGCDVINFEINLRGHSKSSFIEEGTEGGGHWKVNKNKKGEGGSCHVCTFAFFKKMVRFSKWSVIVILQFFLLIIMAVWNIKQTIMKDYDIQSRQWMVCDRFRQLTQDHHCCCIRRTLYKTNTFWRPKWKFCLWNSV